MAIQFSRPRLAIVSTNIRRDLIAPLKYFSQFELIHFYQRAEYGDLTDADFDATLRQYHSPLDLYRQLVAARADVIQGVEPFLPRLQPYLWACYFAAQRTSAQLLAVTLENRPLEIKFGRGIAFALKTLLRFYFARTCAVIVLNEGAHENVRACGIAPHRIAKLMWGTWGIDVNEFAPSSHAHAAPTILFAGRLHAEKGIFVLLNAFARVRQQIPNARLIIVGNGPARSQVEMRAREFGDAITLTGVVKHRAMPDVFRAADVLAMPSLTTRKWAEQVGMVALQAMACGVPIVATHSGAIPEYVPANAGMLVPENDADALAAALIELLRDPERRAQLSRAAREYAIEHYDAQKNIARAENILKERCLAHRL